LSTIVPPSVGELPAQLIRELLMVTLLAVTYRQVVMSLPLITVPSVLIVEGPVYRARVTPVCCHPVVDALGHTVDAVLDVVVGRTVDAVLLGCVSVVGAAPCPEARRAAVTTPRVRRPTVASTRRFALTITPLTGGQKKEAWCDILGSRMSHQAR
jgi:hypothetical protein